MSLKISFITAIYTHTLQPMYWRNFKRTKTLTEFKEHKTQINKNLKNYQDSAYKCHIS